MSRDSPAELRRQEEPQNLCAAPCARFCTEAMGAMDDCCMYFCTGLGLFGAVMLVRARAERRPLRTALANSCRARAHASLRPALRPATCLSPHALPTPAVGLRARRCLCAHPALSHVLLPHVPCPALVQFFMGLVLQMGGEWYLGVSEEDAASSAMACYLAGIVYILYLFGCGMRINKASAKQEALIDESSA